MSYAHMSCYLCQDQSDAPMTGWATMHNVGIFLNFHDLNPNMQ